MLNVPDSLMHFMSLFAQSIGTQLVVRIVGIKSNRSKRQKTIYDDY